MRSHVTTQLAAAALIFGGTAAAAVATASPAAAIGGGGSCQSYELSATVTVDPPPNPEISVNDWNYCVPGPGGIPYPVTISKYIGNNVWQVVASGNGDAWYTCTGGRYLYTTSISSAPFYCG